MAADVLYIVNPISGTSRKAQVIDAILKTRSRILFTEYAGHGAELARSAKEGTVVAVGGDGTVNEVARGLLGTDKKLGIIPCGSGDGLARHLGIPHDPTKAIKAIETGKTQPLDCGMIDGRPFFSVCGVGLDAIVGERFAKAGKRGLETYVKEAISTWRKFQPQKYRITIDGKSYERVAVLITVGNSNQWGNGAKITPLAKSDDGLLDITIVRMFKDLDIPIMADLLMLGLFDKDRHVTCLRGREITIHRSEEGPAHFDGDCFYAGKDIKISLLPTQLQVIIP